MNARKKVFVGLSGGVDSAVSAALLKEQGYDVTGLFAWIALEGYPCSAGEDRREALRVAAHLQIPFLEVDLSDAYRKRIFADAIESYQRGETPNPDALCNREIKFGLLYDFACDHGADLFATGHYARIADERGLHPSSKAELAAERSADSRGKEPEVHLLAGVDTEKDQSYFLWAVPEERLAHTIFPVGSLHKPEVRVLARKFGLPNAARRDSQGLCFLGDVSMEDMLIQELHPAPGDVLNAHGEKIGRHRGAVLYTIGQRHGFEVAARDAHEEPLYVTRKDMTRNTITVSAGRTSDVLPAEEAGDIRVHLRETNWIGTFEDGPCEIRFRYRQKLLPANVRRADGVVTISAPEARTMPVGQSLVIYRGARVLGGGIIT